MEAADSAIRRRRVNMAVLPEDLGTRLLRSAVHDNGAIVAPAPSWGARRVGKNALLGLSTFSKFVRAFAHASAEMRISRTARVAPSPRGQKRHDSAMHLQR